MGGDFSLTDEIYHPDYKNAVVSSGIEHNLEEDKAVVSSIVKAIII